jgi:hypothetical protein
MKRKLTYKVVCNLYDHDFYTDDYDEAKKIFEQYKKDYGDGIRLYEAIDTGNDDDPFDWDIIDSFDEDDNDWEPPDPETKVFRAMEGGTDGG